MRRGRHDKDQIAELAALADGSLDPERGAALREQVAASSELADRLAEQERAVSLARSAATEVEAPPALRARIEAQRRPRRVRAPRGFALAGAAVAAVLVVAIGLTVLRSGSSAQRFQAALGPTKLVPAATGKATLTKTASGWRIQLSATGLPRLDKRALLRGLAPQLVRRARSRRDVQRRPPRDALGRRLAEGLLDADGHARAGRRRSGLVGPEGARRAGRHGQRLARVAVDSTHDLLTRAIEAAHHGAFVDPEGSRRLLVREARDVDGDEDVAEVVG